MADRNHLSQIDLARGAVYQGGPGLGDEPLRNLLGVGNMGGIRPRVDGRGHLAYVVLYSTGDNPDWPDQFDRSRGTFTYFGDNRSPGQDLLKPPGNRTLDRIAKLDLRTPEGRFECPPLLIFELARGHAPRSVSFQGLAVPSSDSSANGIWCTAKYFGTANARYMNFEVHLTILDDPLITRSWLDGLLVGQKLAEDCPSSYRKWLESSSFAPFRAQ